MEFIFTGKLRAFLNRFRNPNGIHSFLFYRPGSCAADSKSLDDNTLNFLKRHSLMDRAVPNSGPRPLLVRTSLNERLTVIAVDPGVRSPAGQAFDVLFVGTTRGKVIKFVSATDPNALNPLDTVKPVVVEEIQVRYVICSYTTIPEDIQLLFQYINIDEIVLP